MVGVGRELAEAARIGTVVRGKYHLDALLGSGGMATVYAATHVNNRLRVAIKMLRRDLSFEPQAVQRFLREGYLANSVEHDGVVKVLDDGMAEDGAAFLIMELLRGETVEQIATSRGGRLSSELLVAIGSKLLDVLSQAHERGIVHRDLKPDNLFVTTKGELKVLDFGIARLKDETSPRLTDTGQTFGTPAFMAPEQALGHGDVIGPHTDVWSVGATLFTLVSGRLVHQGATVNEVLVRAATAEAAPLRAICPEVPDELARVIDRALVRDPRGRFAHAGEMLEALRPIASRWFPEQPLRTLSTSQRPSPRRRPPPRRRGPRRPRSP